MRKTNFGLALLLFFVYFLITASLSGVKSTPSIIDEDLLKRIADEVSGSICFEHIRYMSTLHREFGFEDHHKSAQYMVDKSLEYGLKEAVIEKYPVQSEQEGFRKYVIGNRSFWSCNKGELRLVKPYPKLISSFESATGTVAPGSHSTITTGEIVFIGRGDSEDAYEGKDVKGKIALLERGSHMSGHEIAVHKFGAAGTILYSTWSSYPEEWDAIHGLPIWPRKDKSHEPTFGFNISSNQGLFLKGLLEKGEKVIVSATIEAETIKDAAYELPTAIIPGSVYPNEEFIFYAHLDHPKPGSHDNASGSAVILEIARTLSSLIQNKIIPPPQRTIRFMWVPHMKGMYMYLFHHPEKMGKIKAGCNLDCVGVNQAKFPTEFCVSLPPHSLPAPLLDITNNLVDNFNLMLIQNENKLFCSEGSRNMFQAALRPFRGASDEEHVSTWPWSIPSIYFYDSHLPPRHSQINFLEYLDRTNLKRIAYLGAIISYAWASVNDEIAPELLSEIQYRGKERLERELLLAKNAIEESEASSIHENYAKGKNLLAWGIKREKTIASSLRDIVSKSDRLKHLYMQHDQFINDAGQACMNQLRQYYDLKCKSLDIQPLQKIIRRQRSPLENMIPVYNPEMKEFPGCFRNYSYFLDMAGEDFLEKYEGISSAFRRRNKSMLESFNYIDGKNTIGDIFDAIEAGLWSAGYPQSPYTHISPKELAGYFRLLKDTQVIEFIKK